MAWYKPWTWGDDSESQVQKRDDLNAQGAAAGGFAGLGQDNFGQLGVEAFDQRKRLQDQAMGKTSVSGEMLRQGLQQQLNQQRSMAAGASPQNAAMAARTAANNMGRASYGMSGQAALAGMQEKQAAEKTLADMLMQQRQQEMQVALGSRQNAISGYGGVTPEGSLLDKWGKPVAAAAGLFATSDVRAKHNIKDGDDAAKKVLRGLKAYSYDYKNERDGKGRQFGPMAQDMEKAGLGHAVMDTPDGKVVHGAKAALSSLALTAALAKRVEKLEGKK